MKIKAVMVLPAALVCCIDAMAQQVSGRLINADTRQPIMSAVVSTSADKTRSDINGQFTLQSNLHDTIKINALGYNEYMLPVAGKRTGMTVYMQKTEAMLHEVTISAARNRKADSLNRRRDYASIFSYKPYKITDALTMPSLNQPFTYFSINLGILYQALNKKHDPKLKMQKMLLKDEQGEYIDSRYNKGIISQITGLKGDSLENFRLKYYPAFSWLKATSDYDLINYLKMKFKEFRETGH